MRDPRMNWARNITFTAPDLHRPSSVDELRRLVASTRKIRALGTGHSFNTIADSPGDQVSLADLPSVLHIDAERSTVTVGSGVRYGELAPYLQSAGYAVHNLGSLPHICIAGACATGTHGSGVTNGNLATAVRAIEMVTASGDLVALDRDHADFPGAVVALGMLGIVTSMTLAIEPTYDVAQSVYDELPFTELQDHLDDVLSAAYSASVFTDWRGPLLNAVWLKHRIGSSGVQPAPQQQWFGATLADGPRHPVPGMAVANCTQQLGVPGPWHERLPHFRLDFTPSNGEELQSEYFVARASARGALDALNSIKDRIAPVRQIAEIRTIAADELWLSECYGRDSLAPHFTWVKDSGAVTPVLAAIEEQLAPFGARPHWGKVFTTSPDLVRSCYDRLPDFTALAARYDPTGKFRNDFVDRYIF
ncbi:MAG TPA: FAD-binding protein [Acidothermaceae bacterium]